MATQPLIPPEPDPYLPRESNGATVSFPPRVEDVRSREPERTSRISPTALDIVAVAVVLAVCYIGKVVLVTLMVSILLAFVLEPIVRGLEWIRLPRALGSLVAVLVLLAAIYGTSYFFYNRAVSFARELPKYSRQVQGILTRVARQKNQLQQVGEKVLPQDQRTKEAVPVNVVDTQNGLITKSLGTVTEAAMTLGFIPFLVYFMLSWQEHARTQTVQLFPPESRGTAYVTLGRISSMMRRFIAANFILGVFMAACSVAAFSFLKLPYFYFLGIISGFFSLVPYLGVILALFVPLTAGIGILNTTGILIVVVTVSALHVIATTVLYPKFIGGRLRLNPLVVSIGLLVWGGVWGAMGLVLAVPMLAAIKIVCDHVPPLQPWGAWMGE